MKSAAQWGSMFEAKRARPAPELTRSLERFLERAQRECPHWVSEDEGFVRHVASHLSGAGNKAEALDGAHAGDLLLAWSCAQGDAAALAAFEQRFIPEAKQALSSRGESESAIDDVLQLLRQRLFVAQEDREQKIRTYSGRGPLAVWVRMAAVRMAQNARRGEPNKPTDDEAVLQTLPSPFEEMELRFLKAKYRGVFSAAFAAAFDSLDKRERNLLRLHAVEGLANSALARMFRVDVATTRRWLAAARKKLLDKTRAHLLQRVPLRPSEVGSLLRALQSQLEVSLRTLLEKP